MQVQKPGEAGRAHLDLLGDYLRNVTVKAPWLRQIKHSLKKNSRYKIELVVSNNPRAKGLNYAKKYKITK